APLLILYFAFGALKSSDVYKEALAKAKDNDAVKQALGEPVEDAFMPMGSINIQNDTGHADLQVFLKGPKGAAQYHIVADKKGGKWTYQTLEVTVPEQNGQPSKTINLLQANNEPRGILVPTPFIVEPADLVLQSTGAQTLAPAGPPAGSFTQIVAASRITQLGLFARTGNPGERPRD